MGGGGGGGEGDLLSKENYIRVWEHLKKLGCREGRGARGRMPFLSNPPPPSMLIKN